MYDMDIVRLLMRSYDACLRPLILFEYSYAVDCICYVKYVYDDM